MNFLKKIFLNLRKLRWRLFLAFILLLIPTLYVINLYNATQMRKQLSQEFEKRSKALTANLAHNAQYGVLVKDSKILQDLTDGIMERDDVIYVIIYDTKGNILAQSAKPNIPISHLIWDSLFVVEEEITEEKQIGGLPVLDRTVVVQVEKEENTNMGDDDFFFEEGFGMMGEPAPAPVEEAATPEMRVEGVVRLGLSQETLEKEIANTLIWGGLLTLCFALIGVAYAFWFSGRVIRPLRQLTNATRIISEGNLEHRIENIGSDEIGYLARNFNGMADSLRDIIKQLRLIATQLTTASSQILDTANNGAGMAAQQASSIAETSSTVQELAKTAEQISGSANMVFDRANATLSSAKEGTEAMGNANEKMDEIKKMTEFSRETILALGELSNRIGGVSQLIEEIADRTKLIAFNAAIEAAGAGETGRRFGVVANEVRTLASQTGTLTKDIDLLIEEIQVAVDKAVESSEANVRMVGEGTSGLNDTSQAFNHIQDMITQTTRSAREISLATRQQETASNQVVEVMSELAQASQSAASGSRDTMNAATELNKLAEQLKNIVDRFVVNE